MQDWETADEMDDAMVENWNSVVKPHDKVYHLGDAVIQRRCLKTLGRLNGKKQLIRGNHDIFRTKEYMEYFEEIHGKSCFWRLSKISCSFCC